MGVRRKAFFPVCAEKGPDVCVCSDYRTLELDTRVFQTYQEIEVIAWSLGVFVANRVLLHSGLPVVKAAAINGTLYPYDDEKGIPIAVFDGTEKNLTEENLLKFQRRMCGSAKSFEKFQTFNFSFPIPELQDALQNIRMEQEKNPLSSGENIFTDVIIGLSDRIFPTNNQKRAWENFPNIRLEEIAHYDEEIWGTLDKLCQK